MQEKNKNLQYLLVAFMVVLALLKVTGVMTASWLWVFIPIWAPFAFAAFIIGLFAMSVFGLVSVMMVVTYCETLGDSDV